MRKYTILPILLISLHLNSQYLEITFKTELPDAGEHVPNHILAAWVKDNNGLFVNTLLVYANDYAQLLFEWNVSSGGFTPPDAVTGATLLNHDSTHVVKWDLKNYAKDIISNGAYTLCLETTSGDIAGPYREIEFTIDGIDFNLQPENENGFKDITIVYENGEIGVTSIDYNNKYLKCMCNPELNFYMVEVMLERNSASVISVINGAGQLVNKERYTFYKGKNRLNISSVMEPLPSGIYSVILETDHYIVGRQIVK